MRRSKTHFLTIAVLLIAGQSIATANPCDGWLPNHVGNGVRGTIYASVIYNNEFYIGGDFTRTSDGRASRIARWDGTHWRDVGIGVDGTVNALAEYNGDLYVGGSFNRVNTDGSTPGIAAEYIARWDGTTWSSVGQTPTDLNDTVYALTVFNDNGTNKLFAGGSFYISSSMDRIASYDGNNNPWTSTGPLTHVNGGGAVRAFTVFNGSLLASGEFGANASGSGWACTSSGAVLEWNGTSWPLFNLCGGMTHGSTYAMTEYNGELIIGGNYANRILRWDASVSQFVAFQGGISGGLNTNGVRALAVMQGVLAVGGDFDTANGVGGFDRLAIWNGTAWRRSRSFTIWPTQCGANIGGGGAGVADGIIHTITARPSHGHAIAAGAFTIAGGLSANSVAILHGLSGQQPLQTLSAFNGATWFTANGIVESMVEMAGDLIVGGNFDEVGTSPGNWTGGHAIPVVARWTGVNWESLGDELRRNGGHPEVHAMALRSPNELIVGGTFSHTFPGNLAVANVASWDRTTGLWSPMGAGLPGMVECLFKSPSWGVLLAGGSFSTGGGNQNIARFNGAQWVAYGTLPGRVNALAEHHGEIYAGTTSAPYLFKWDGISTWNGVNDAASVALNGSVEALHDLGTHLGVGGSFTGLTNAAIAAYFVRWDGATSTWDNSSSGLLPNAYSWGDQVCTIGEYGGQPVAGGGFHVSATNRGVAMLGGTTWAQMGGGIGNATCGGYIPPTLYSQKLFQGVLHVGGGMGAVDGQPAEGLGRWADKCVAPTITGQPVVVTVHWTYNGRMEIATPSLGPVTYQWRKFGVPLSDSERISGSTSPVLDITAVNPEDAGEYDCVVTTPYGQVISDSAPLYVLTLTGDLNGDCVVDLMDLATLLAHFGVSSGATTGDGDLDGDADVDINDLTLVLGSFGQTCP